MTAQTANKVTVPVGTDGWNPVAHIKGAFESALIIIPVADEAERDTLPQRFPGGIIPKGTEIVILNDSTLPKQKWNGQKWVQFIYAEANASILVQPNLPWGSGQLTLNQTNSTDLDFVSFPQADCIQFTAPGLYTASAHMKVAAGQSVSGFTKGTIQNGNGTSVYGQEYPAMGATEFVMTAPVMYFPDPGGQAFIKFFQNSGAQQTWSTILRIGKIG